MTPKEKQQTDELELLLSRQGDDDLTPEETETLARLLDADPHRQTAKQYRQVADLLETLSEQDLPVDWSRFRLGVQERIDADRRRRLTGSRLVRIFTPLAAAACIAVVASLYWSVLQEEAHRPAQVALTALPVVEIAYSRPAPMSARPEGKTLSVAFDRTPPSPDWKPVYKELMDRPAVAMCGPDPAPDNPASKRMPVF